MDPEPGKGKTVAPPAQGGADGGDEEEDPTGANQFLEAKVKGVEQEVATQGELLSKGNKKTIITECEMGTLHLGCLKDTELRQ